MSLLMPRMSYRFKVCFLEPSILLTSINHDVIAIEKFIVRSSGTGDIRILIRDPESFNYDIILTSLMLMGDDETKRFSIKVSDMTPNGDLTRVKLLTGCKIKSIEHQDLDYRINVERKMALNVRFHGYDPEID